MNSSIHYSRMLKILLNFRIQFPCHLSVQKARPVELISCSLDIKSEEVGDCSTGHWTDIAHWAQCKGF